MATDLPNTGTGPGPRRNLGSGIGSGEFEEPKAPEQRPLVGGEEEDELLPQVERPIVKPDNWAGG
ncbi:hypothetical protein NGB36_08660 [Streptomyces sp. RB6PN25]|uniref:Uncharacterized protein n=1 Tax=Streptomyces humicola TaxID=2953240 RepID=A0ABT1PSM5_9ACTN|nr:hypothetical protein [Streptomyces humicola]MCQ4080670.1 hypothetical protein [Streptomyces humicola]